MEVSRDTKYYIYTQEDQFGPFSQELIIEELQSENIGADASIWREGMADWQNIREVQEFKDYVHFLPESTQLKVIFKKDIWNGDEGEYQDDVEELQIIPEAASSQSVEGSLQILGNSTKEVFPEPSPEKQGENQEPPQKSSALWWGLGLSFIPIVALAAGVYLFVAERNYKETLENLDATFSESQAFKNILSGKESQWNAIAIHKELGEQKEPTLLMAVPFPDQTRIAVTLVGESETLVGALHYQQRLELVVQNRMARTLPLRQPSGSYLPPGTYTATLSCLTCHQNKYKNLQFKQKIVVGVTNQEAYKEELRIFHTLIRKQAESELVEVEEIMSLLEEGLHAPQATDPEMVSIQQQLQQILFSINEDIARTSYFYGDMYLKLKSIYFKMTQNDVLNAQRDLSAARVEYQRYKQGFNSSVGYPKK